MDSGLVEHEGGKASTFSERYDEEAEEEGDPPF
jgi:hypothetical protein